VFITFEGPEGSGKTTQIALLADVLRTDGVNVVTTREPGGVEQAEAIRELVLAGGMAPEAEAMLFLAARAEHARRKLIPALEEGAVVLCDRFNDSTLAYQGYGLGLDLEALRALCAFASVGLTPSLTLLLDLRVEIGLSRRGTTQMPLALDLDEVAQATQDVNAIDKRGLDFHRRVRRGFLAEAEREPARIQVIDAARPVKAVHQAILKVIRAHMRESGSPA
jgi:dTMP kinase